MISKPVVPATVANLDHAIVVEILGRNGCNITVASQELGVPASDLRRLLWANAQLQDQALEAVEARLDKAEANIHEALHSDDSRRRDAASFFVVRNTGRAKRRGWITSASAGVEVNVNTGSSPREIIFRWRTPEDDVRDAEAAERERAEDARLRDEGQKLIEHAPVPAR
jgi:hypothetical protein